MGKHRNRRSVADKVLGKETKPHMESGRTAAKRRRRHEEGQYCITAVLGASNKHCGRLLAGVLASNLAGARHGERSRDESRGEKAKTIAMGACRAVLVF